MDGLKIEFNESPNGNTLSIVLGGVKAAVSLAATLASTFVIS